MGEAHNRLGGAPGIAGEVQSTAAKPGPRIVALAATALVLMTLAAYVPAMQAGFIWDDDAYVEKNYTLRAPDGLWRIWSEFRATPQYYPLVHSSYWLEYRMWGRDPTGYHVVNVLLHALAGLLVWRVLAALGQPFAASWAVAAVFLLHPVHVESVAWITERKNVLSAVFYLGSLLAFLRFDASGSDGSLKGRAPWLYLLSLMLFASALLSKTVTATLPGALLLLLWWRRGRVRRGDLKATAPLFMLGVALGLVTVWLERSRVGAVGAAWDLSLVERTLIAGRALWFYAGKLALPLRLAFVYPRWSIDASAAWQYLFPLGAVSITAVLWATRRRIGRGPLTAVLFSVGTLLPALGFFDVYPMLYSWVADHFQYLASLGPVTLVVIAVCRAVRRLDRAGRKAPVAILLVTLATLGTLTWNRAGVFHDRESLWRDTVRKNPGSWMGHANLAGELQARGEYDEALEYFREALTLQEEWPHAADRAQTHNNIGLVLVKQGRVDEAVRHFREALRLDSGCATANNNLGVILQAQGEIDGAIRLFRRALERRPDYAKAHYNLGTALASQGRLRLGIAHFRLSLRFDPDDLRARDRIREITEAQAQGGQGRAMRH